MRQQKGFTLIEMLVVVVIIAVLAALTVPRFLQQPEKAVIAEANQMLGALVRAQNNYIDAGYGPTWIGVDQTTNSLSWTRLGVQAPGTTNFTYTCGYAALHTRCNATRSSNGGAYAGAMISVDDTGAWNCVYGPGGVSRNYTSSSTGGCTIGA